MLTMLKAHPAALLEALGYTNVISAAAYVGATIYGLLGPVLVAVLAISHGARSIAGDEEQGTLDLLLAHPVSRVQVAMQRLASLICELAVVGVVLWGALLLVAG